MYPLAVRVHCGSAHVHGNARNYFYVIAQVFEPKERADGVVTYRSTGRIVGPYRSAEKCEREGRQLAEREGAVFIEGYGSLHGRRPETVLPASTETSLAAH